MHLRGRLSGISASTRAPALEMVIHCIYVKRAKKCLLRLPSEQVSMGRNFVFDFRKNTVFHSHSGNENV